MLFQFIEIRLRKSDFAFLLHHRRHELRVEAAPQFLREGFAIFALHGGRTESDRGLDARQF